MDTHIPSINIEDLPELIDSLLNQLEETKGIGKGKKSFQLVLILKYQLVAEDVFTT